MSLTNIKKSLFVSTLFLFGSAWAAEVSIDVQLTPVGSFTATTNKVSGQWIQKDGKILAKDISIEIDSFVSGVELRDKHMNKEYFESEKYPKATLKKALGKDGKFVGQLEVHGQTKKINGTYKVSGDEVTAEFTTALSTFAIKEANYMGVGVNDKIKVTTTVPLKK